MTRREELIERVKVFFEGAVSNIMAVDNEYSCTAADRDATDAEIAAAETLRDDLITTLEAEYGAKP